MLRRRLGHGNVRLSRAWQLARMRRLLAVVTAAALASPALVSPALAQNAGQIARVRAGASCPGCNLFQADLANLELKAKNFSGARLRQADASGAVLSRTRFAHGDLRDFNAYGAVMTGADLRGADLTHATLVGAYLEGADLSGARLEGANLSGAEMERARGLTAVQIAQACGDEATKLPRGMRAPPCR